jgi:hypothetical protein
MLFGAIVLELITGILLYLGFAGWIADLHLVLTWVIVAYLPAHLAVHFAMGGVRQLLRIFNPGKLAPPPPAFDPYDLLAEALMKDDRLKRGSETQSDTPVQPGSRPARQGEPQDHETRRPHRRDQVLHTHPLAIALGGGLAALAMLMSLDQVTRDELVIEEIWADTKRPVIDGDVSDPIWRSARPVRVRTQQGANLDGEGGSMVEIRAVHDST